jgi:hypothetical protein
VQHRHLCGGRVEGEQVVLDGCDVRVGHGRESSTAAGSAPAPDREAAWRRRRSDIGLRDSFEHMFLHFVEHVFYGRTCVRSNV